MKHWETCCAAGENKEGSESKRQDRSVHEHCGWDPGPAWRKAAWQIYQEYTNIDILSAKETLGSSLAKAPFEPSHARYPKMTLHIADKSQTFTFKLRVALLLGGTNETAT